MLNLILVILIFNFMLMLMKLFKRYNVDNLQAIIVNYFTAGLMGMILMEGEWSFGGILKSDWIYYAFAVGLLFILTFNLLATATQTVGLAVATVANKMSVVIPIAAAFILYHDVPTLVKITGILLALLGIYLTSTDKGKLSFDRKYLWLVVVIFVGQGIADMLFNHARFNYVPNDQRMLFFMVIFFAAGLLGLLFSALKLAKGGSAFKLKNVIWGIALGVPNYYTLEFFFKALNNSYLDSSQVYPIINMGIVVLSSFLGLFLFREKLTKTNWIGILLAVFAIALLSLEFD